MTAAILRIIADRVSMLGTDKKVNTTYAQNILTINPPKISPAESQLAYVFKLKIK